MSHRTLKILANLKKRDEVWDVNHNSSFFASDFKRKSAGSQVFPYASTPKSRRDNSSRPISRGNVRRPLQSLELSNSDIECSPLDLSVSSKISSKNHESSQNLIIQKQTSFVSCCPLDLSISSKVSSENLDSSQNLIIQKEPSFFVSDTCAESPCLPLAKEIRAKNFRECKSSVEGPRLETFACLHNGSERLQVPNHFNDILTSRAILHDENSGAKSVSLSSTEKFRDKDPVEIQTSNLLENVLTKTGLEISKSAENNFESSHVFSCSSDNLTNRASLSDSNNDNSSLFNVNGVSSCITLGSSLVSNNLVTPDIEINSEPSASVSSDLSPVQNVSDTGEICDKPASSVISSINEVTSRKRKKSTQTKDEKMQAKKKALVEKHSVLPGCEETCRKKCVTVFSEERRAQINSEYWNLSWGDRRNFIKQLCSRSEVKRRIPNSSEYKKNTFFYFFQTPKGDFHEVCKVFFLATLGFKSNNSKVVGNVLSNCDPEIIQPVFIDRRGKTSSSNKGPWDLIDAHIESFNPNVSHYRREHAPNMRYLPSDVTVAHMHGDFNAKYPEHAISYDLYRKIVKKKKISFAKLGTEECEKCEEFKLHGHSKDDFQENCDTCQMWKKHITLASEARKLYQKHAEKTFSTNGVVCFSADLQKVIMLPRIDTFKAVLFIQRLTVYHEQLRPLVRNQNLNPTL